MATSQTCLDDILKEIGDFGKYQFRIIIFICIGLGITCIPLHIWLLETKQLNYRCEITGCETDAMEYRPSWWTDAIPSIDNKPSNCERYKLLNNSNQTENCIFDKNIVEKCDKYIYETTKTTIIRDFNLQCIDNVWKLTLVGTINSAGLFVGLPISGILIDKFGRKTTLIFSVTLSSIMGIIRSFTNSYIFYIIMTFTDAFFRAAAYSTCIIMGVELVRPSKRGLVNVLVNIVATIFEASVGVVAWILPSWRTLDRVVYGLSLVIVFYYWLIPESLRWLLVNKRYADVENVLQEATKANGTTLSQESLQKLWNSCSSDANKSVSLRDLFKSFSLLTRLLHCCICWFCCNLSFYGLIVNSVTLSENGYLDLTLATLIDIPGCILTYLLVDRIGRRYCLAIGFLVSGLSCLSFIFVPEDLYGLKLSLYLLGKLGTAVNVVTIYILTSEIFPTALRGLLLSICSMAGRMGAMVAPQTPLLAIYWKAFPLTLFTATSILGCVLSVLLPETMDVKLPETMIDMEVKRNPKSQRNNCVAPS